ncbi:MAG: hypothetical protein NXH70_04310 [Hyphomonas sp.]|nr:hypothetical protein [Alphaproteobacteria bacterium]MCR9223272.1 hypothetical protein [Hyphomonas sp.]
MSESEQLDRVLATMRLLQSHLEEANFEVTEFEEVEIFLDLALNAGEQLRKPEHAPVLDRYFK